MNDTPFPCYSIGAQTDDESEKIIVSSWSEPKNGRKGTKAILEVEQYRMKAIPRGICLIISNTCFVAARKADIDLGDRDGGSIDVEKLKDLFEWLKFKVETFNDLTRDDMDRTLMSFANMDHKEFDCFVCCILTHGSKEGLFGTDGEILDFKFIKDLYNGANCPSLGQKPKLFFLQCCRGELMDKGFCTDGFEGRSLGGQIRATDPIESDFFIGYPTPLGKEITKKVSLKSESLRLRIIAKSVKSDKSVKRLLPMYHKIGRTEKLIAV